MRVGFDVDGILADFNKTFIERVVRVTCRDLFPPRPFDITTWNYPEHYGYTAAENSAIWKGITEDETFWASLEPYEEVRAIIGALRHMEHDTYFITSRPGATSKIQTEAWLEIGLGITGPTVLISSEKGECAHALKLTHYVDDRLENCEDVVAKSPETACFMLARPWNHEIPGVPRIASLAEFPVFG